MYSACSFSTSWTSFARTSCCANSNELAMFCCGESHRLFSDILGAFAGGLGLSLERADGLLGRGNEAVEGLPGLLDALFGKRPHFGGNFETIWRPSSSPPAVRLESLRCGYGSM